MNPILNKINNIHTIWLLMIALTLFTYVFGKLGYNGLFVTLILLLTAVIKGTLIIRDFMELRDVSFLWRAIMFGWIWTVALALAITFMISL